MTPRVGQVLRQARTQRGIELSEVERVTKIREKFLRAMEEDRWEALPAPAYARGFLEIYARFLGLDDEALVDEYRRTVPEADRPEPIPPSVLRPGALKPRRSVRPFGVLAAGLLAAAVLALVVVGIVGTLSDGGDSADDGEEMASPATTDEEVGTSAGLPAVTPVSLELRSTGEVWVCLVDDRDRPQVNGETLLPDEVRGPFTSEAFEVTFGNGSVEMTVDGEPAEVPALAEPLGFRITADGVSRLDPASQPTCL